MTTHYKRQGVNGDLKFEAISPSIRLILKTAKEYGIKCQEIPYVGMFVLTHRGKKSYLHAQPPTGNDRTSMYCCKNKAITKLMLSSKNISVPKGFVITKSDTINYWKSVYKALNKPLVVKPIDTSEASNVHANITTLQEFISATKEIFKYFGELNQNLLVEEMFKGTEYRILATRDKVIGIMSRIPANVIGDGIHTIKELVSLKNKHPWRGSGYILKKIKLEKAEIIHLKKSGWNISDIPPKKQQVYLRNTSPLNIDQGGDTIDCTSIAHPSVAKIAMRAVRAIPGLTWAGMDFFSRDISKIQEPKDYIVLEINTSPNIAWQEFPAVGKRKEVALEYLKIIFPNLGSRANPQFSKQPKISSLSNPQLQRTASSRASQPTF
jgi:D-alanine-D-alanine ligase-like ATP-grasp enzyme